MKKETLRIFQMASILSISSTEEKRWGVRWLPELDDPCSGRKNAQAASASSFGGCKEKKGPNHMGSPLSAIRGNGET